MRPHGVADLCFKGETIGHVATVANSYEQGRLQVFNRCSLTSETLRLERILTEAEVKQLGLQLGGVKLYAT